MALGDNKIFRLPVDQLPIGNFVLSLKAVAKVLDAFGELTLQDGAAVSQKFEEFPNLHFYSSAWSFGNCSYRTPWSEGFGYDRRSQGLHNEPVGWIETL